MKCKLLFIGSLMVLASCTKTANREESPVQQSENRVDYLGTTNSFQARVQIYNLLSPAERFKMWDDHFLMAKNQFLSEGNMAKLAIVKELKDKLTTAVFINGTSDNSVFLNYFMPAWAEKAKKVFTDQELYDLTFDPTSATIGSVVAPPDTGGGGGPAPGCFCNVGTSGFSCRKITVGIPSGVTITNGICELAGNCEPSNAGCGWLWLSSCNGDHCNF